MEPRTKSVLMWTGIVCLCFFGVPVYFKGEDQEKLEMAFKNYTKEFNKSYDDEQIEKNLPKFQSVIQKIQELNARDNENILLMVSPSLKSNGGSNQVEKEEEIHRLVSHQKWKHGQPKNQGYATWGLTEFSDISPEEFKEKYLHPEIHEKILSRERNHRTHPDPHHHHHHHGEVSSDSINSNYLITRKRRALSIAGPIPAKVDWRTKNVVTPVLHQKSCGACWAFSTVETVESMRAIQTGTLEPLSIQHVIDCATNGNMGCNGGDTCGALSWMIDNKLVPATQYPLTLKDTPCKLRSTNTGVKVNANYTCDSYEGVEDLLLTVLAHHGPVAAAVDATNWQFYVGGVIQWNCDANNNHAIQIVGYDKTATPPHYIIRNSWGTSFGDNGYLYVAIGSNLCGIAREVSSLTVQ